MSYIADFQDNVPWCEFVFMCLNLGGYVIQLEKLPFFFNFYLSPKVQAQVCYLGKVCHEVCCTDHFITPVLSLVPFSCFS